MLENREGKRVPDVTFKVIEGTTWKDITTDDLFKGKKVVVFALPGAYTPTCSSSHLPRFNELAQVFKKHGIDDVICLSVNDTFVMNEWKKYQEAENVTLIPDGNGAFTEGMGMLVDKSFLGFGKRSWRYSMLVDDKVIKKMFIEPQVDGDPFEVSDADTMLDYVAPEAEKPKFFTMFTKRGCPHCARAKKLLDEEGMLYEEVELDRNITSRTLRAVSGGTTTPQVFTEGKRIGTADELETYLRK
ncbi:MAG: glutathione peroxidase [Myxococcota bacterium]